MKPLDESETYGDLRRAIEDISEFMKGASEKDIPEFDKRMKHACELLRKVNDELSAQGKAPLPKLVFLCHP